MSGGDGAIRVGIDGYNLAMPHGTGVATYARTLAAAVRALVWPVDLFYGIPVTPEAAPELRETLFYGRLSEEEFRSGTPTTLNWRLRRYLLGPQAVAMVDIPTSNHVIAPEIVAQVPEHDRLFTKGRIFELSAAYFRRYRRFMTIKVKDPPSIMHWTYPLPIKLQGARNIYTIHDLVPLRLPHTSLEDKRYYHDLVSTCVATASHIVTVSEASRTDILDLLGAAPEKVTNTYQPIDARISGPTGEDELRGKLASLFDLPLDGYFLFFGAIEPKKNVGRLIEAYLRSDVKTPLVIVGTGGWKSDRELRLLNGGTGTSLPGAARIRKMDHVPRDLLVDLIRGARAVLFPSLYEGFGLPAAEALMLGTPLLTSRTPALAEIVGDAALLVDPYDAGGMAEAIRRIDGDPELRLKLSVAGKKRAAVFNDADYRLRLKNVYLGLS